MWTDKKIHEQHHEGGEGVLKLGFVQNLHNKGVRQLSSDYRMTKPRTGSFKKEKKLSKQKRFKNNIHLGKNTNCGICKEDGWA